MGGKGSGGYRKNALPRDKNPLLQAANPDVNPDVNHRMIERGKEIMRLPELDYSDADALEQRFFDFLDLCDKYSLRPMVSVCASAFGMNRHTYQGIAVGDPKYDNWHGGILTPRCRTVIQKSYEFLNQAWETYLVEEKGNPVRWIFMGKNYFDMRDQTEHVQIRREERPTLTDPQELASKYAAMVGQPQATLAEAEIVEIEDASDSEES